MEGNTKSHLYHQRTARDEHGEDLIRQDHSIRVLDGRTLVAPNAFEEVELPLAMSLKPNVSKALDMPGGVSIVLKCMFLISLIHLPCAFYFKSLVTSELHS
jgi:hypothetical protein